MVARQIMGEEEEGIKVRRKEEDSRRRKKEQRLKSTLTNQQAAAEKTRRVFICHLPEFVSSLVLSRVGRRRPPVDWGNTP